MITLLLAISYCLLLAGCDNSAMKGNMSEYKPPFDTSYIRQQTDNPYKKRFRCKHPPAPMKDLFFESMYDKSSKNSSIINPDAYTKYKTDIKPLQTFESGLATTANRYLQSNPARPEIAACTMSWISIWADADALLGESNASGEFLRKWVLSSISLAYLQVRDDPYISPDMHEKTHKWLKKVARRVKEDFSKNPDNNSRNNNHMYWAAWGVMSAAIALDNQELFDWALYEAKVGVQDIQENGTMPLEIARGPKAYHYHHFAAIPLFLMAETAYANGINLYDGNDKALKRLARALLENIEDQTLFEELTGEKQNMDRTVTSSSLVWLEIYRRHYNDKDADKWLKKFRPVKHSRAGGDATLLYKSRY